MLGSIVLDIFLIVLLVAYLVYGYRTGLIRSLGGIIGIVIGAFLAILLVPLVTSWVQDPTLRTIATIAVVVAVVVGGYSAGAVLGRFIQSRVKGVGLRRVDRALGAVVVTVVAALVMSMLAASISALGVPFISQAIASSNVIRAINDITPDPVESFLAQVRSATVDQSLPRIAEAFGGSPSTTVPNVNTSTPALNAAALSVVRITGNAYACGQSQSGSGFVISPDRVLTNAHVVAGVTNPVVDVRNGPALPSTIVYFDPVGDLAVLSVPGLDLKPLSLGPTVSAGTDAVSDGYPFGGPFVSLQVGVDQVGTVNVQNIYSTGSSPREIYSLAANVQEGDSGGPLLTTSGVVAGVIFAKGATTANVGYAITMKSVAPVAREAPTLTTGVSSGRCTRG
ncbi:MAG TPA: MarP family serine protease [Galbitalea sp.]|jgi:S1-C subfamily serine protease|nr:MarP family serine protease [Galbitalea sp.]